MTPSRRAVTPPLLSFFPLRRSRAGDGAAPPAFTSFTPHAAAPLSLSLSLWEGGGGRLLRGRAAMKDLSLFLLKNSLSSKLKKGIRNFCSGAASTTTLEQQGTAVATEEEEEQGEVVEPPMTLEQMIRRLEMEEAAARRAKVAAEEEEDRQRRRRMSCVNSSDVLRSARRALDQYPRFSLDGRDAMYRSSFLAGGERRRFAGGGTAVVAGERLMGLEAVPVPVPPPPVAGWRGRLRPSAAAARKESLRRTGRRELEKERLVMGLRGHWRPVRRRESVGSCSAPPPPEEWPDWRRFAGFR
ncbi:unnamed protein product [Spirodela intermedia]|uniref:Uncharacterized protein n=1 Tax=Spirodela intermedia TaxID=51605 RepID=A0A7I8IV84_SPIIN|nr:unnamed protein product [Spirodela intermedia]CAA6661915.1 unnamed protein product [Spirodela intermedia]